LPGRSSVFCRRAFGLARTGGKVQRVSLYRAAGCRPLRQPRWLPLPRQSPNREPGARNRAACPFGGRGRQTTAAGN